MDDISMATVHKCWKQTMLVCRAPMREVWRKRERVGYLLGKQVLWTKGWNRGHWTCNFIKVAQSSSQRTSKWSPGHEEGRHRMGTFQWAGWAISPMRVVVSLCASFPFTLVHPPLCHSKLNSVLTSCRKSPKKSGSLVFILHSSEMHRHLWWRICVFWPGPFAWRSRAPEDRAWAQQNKHVRFFNVIGRPFHHLAWL